MLRARDNGKVNRLSKKEDTDGRDYPFLSATPTSMLTGPLNSLSPIAVKDLPENDKQQDDASLGVHQKLAHYEIKTKRLVSQIQEMNLEYKCQKT